MIVTSTSDGPTGSAATGLAETTLVVQGALMLLVSSNPEEFARDPIVLPSLQETIAAKAGSGTLAEDVEVWITQPSRRLATALAPQRIASPLHAGSRRVSSME